MMTGSPVFTAVALQTEAHYCLNADEVMTKNVRRIAELIDFLPPYAGGISGAPCRLIVLPEFALQGLPQAPDGSWNGVAMTLPGPETDLLGTIARKHGLYIAAHGWVEYPGFLGRPFSVGFIIGPDGDIIHRHHKLVTTKVIESASTSPQDAWDWFTAEFGDGLDSFFPVTETDIGNLGFLICGEGQYPEIARGLMLNGAELLLRPNAWSEPMMAEPQDMMATVSRYNAWANMCYVVEANISRYYAGPFPKAMGPGQAAIYDYAGRIVSRSASSAESFTCAELNIDTLREYRRNCNVFARTAYMPMDILRRAYQGSDMWPKNLLTDADGSKTILDWEMARQAVVKARPDIFKKPGNGGR